MLRSMLAALLLASPLSAQVASVKTSIPVYTGAPGVISFQTPALNSGFSSPVLAAGLTPSLAPAPAQVPVLSAPAVQPTGVPVQGAQALTPLRTAVRTFGDELRAIPATLTGLFDAAAAAGEPNPAVFSAGLPVRSLESIKQLKIGSYNVLNLFEKVGKHVPDPDNPGKLKKVSDAKPKEEWSLREQGKIIIENDLDIVTLAEVENIAALRNFNERYLAGKYNVYLIEGNDERGIDIAFLVKKDLPLVVEQRSHKKETWVDPMLGGGPRKLFSRDLTSLVVRAAGRAEPMFVLFGTHFKSKRDRGGDPESRILRAAQVQRSAEIVARYRKEFGAGVPIMFAGDFNGEVGHEAEFKPLFEAAGLTDSFDASPNPSSDKDRITHTYHPKDGAAHYGQMDAVLVSKGLRGAVKKAETYRYKNADGSVRPIPKTLEEREKNPSDHFPVIVTLDFTPIRTGVFTEKTAQPAPMGSLELARRTLFAAAGGEERGGRAELASLRGEQLLAYARSAELRAWVAAERARGRHVFWPMDMDKTMVFADSYPLFFSWRVRHRGFTLEQERSLKSFLARTGLLAPEALDALEPSLGAPSRKIMELWDVIVTQQPNGITYLEFVNSAYWLTQKGLTRAQKDEMMRGFASEFAALVPPLVVETNRALAEAGVEVVLLSTAEDEFLPYAARLLGMDPKNAAQGSALQYDERGVATGGMFYHDIDDKGKAWSGRKPLPGKYLHFMEWLEGGRARWPDMDQERMVIAAMSGDSADFDGGFMYYARPVLANFIVDTPGEPKRREKFLAFAERWLKPLGLGSFITLRYDPYPPAAR